MYETKNTAVAAAIKTLGGRVTGMSHDDGSVVWMLDSGSYNDERDVGLCFQRRGYSIEPLAAIIRVANAREWLLNNVIHGCYEIEADSDSFATTSIAVASCLVAANYYLRAFYGRTFFFAPDACDFVNGFKRRPKGNEALDWQRRFLYEFSELLHRAREARICQ